MSDLKINLTNMTDAQIVAHLKAEVARRQVSHLRSANYWWGFATGALLMAALNIGDMHLCVGECDGQGFSILGGETSPSKGF